MGKGGPPAQPPHVVVGEGVRPAGIVHLLDLANQVIDVIHAQSALIARVGEALEDILILDFSLIT